MITRTVGVQDHRAMQRVGYDLRVEVVRRIELLLGMRNGQSIVDTSVAMLLTHHLPSPKGIAVFSFPQTWVAVDGDVVVVDERGRGSSDRAFTGITSARPTRFSAYTTTDHFFSLQSTVPTVLVLLRASFWCLPWTEPDERRGMNVGGERSQRARAYWRVNARSLACRSASSTRALTRTYMYSRAVVAGGDLEYTKCIMLLVYGTS